MVTQYFPEPKKIAIIGLGPRGLSVFERLLRELEATPDIFAEISIFEPRVPGTGAHSVNQPDHMMLNTVAGQMGVYPDAAALRNVPGSLPRNGPDFLTWCQRKGIRVNEQGHIDAENGREVQYFDFLPRRLAGEYLNDTFEALQASTPSNVSVSLYPERVERIGQAPWTPTSQGEGYRLLGDKGTLVDVSDLIVTTGHDASDDLHRQMNAIVATDQVAVQGLGLTAMDVLAELTQGRGGHHDRSGHGCRYQASGEEPQILVQSRQGLPFRARPETSLQRQRHRAIVLTSERVKTLRNTLPKGQFDFERDILPLMRLEMRSAALAVHMSAGDGEMAAEALLKMAKIGQNLRTGIVDLCRYLEEQETIFGSLDLDQLLNLQTPEHLTDTLYQNWLIEQVQSDLEAAKQGLLHSPLKAAAEVWRDLRDTLRSIVDFGGLTMSSHRVFYRDWVGKINRMVAGPQKERCEELLALVEANIVTLKAPNTRVQSEAKILRARVPHRGLCGLTEGIFADLKQMNRICAVVAAPGFDGIKVDANHRALDAYDQPTPSLWVLGPPTEGSSYYNHYIAAPGAPNRAFADAARVAKACLAPEQNIPNRRTA
ncbi:FAD/NAD(P)-binding protein [Epibacterium ulvae]|uniref:FAD/NAD(P)-binding protein n=1 Tax=Epibacterium ulvae TaxID=1156985 RepID=UPI00248F71F0|nr:FAD/NAD(P)-binding protein [Epibacterium ulvae]